MIKLVILDRDGVINVDSEAYIKSPDEWHPIEGSLEAIARLNDAGIQVAIATNQSGIARGYFTEQTLRHIHEKMESALMAYGGYIDQIFYCPHGPNDRCECRKPKPGLLKQALQYFSVLPNEACFVGDSPRDIEAAKSVGVRPIAVGHKKIISPDIEAYASLNEFVHHLLGK